MGRERVQDAPEPTVVRKAWPSSLGQARVPCGFRRDKKLRPRTIPAFQAWLEWDTPIASPARSTVEGVFYAASVTADLRVDTTFDFRTDTPEGDDPDAVSPTLKRYHYLLWSKALPSGKLFNLVETKAGGYLYHQSELGEFWMTSDSVVHTYRYWSRFRLPEIVNRFSREELDDFDRLSYTMGAMMLFPSWTGVRHWSINQARGMLSKIADRMDLTLECIRLHYARLDSPMSKTLAWYADYFILFNDFDGFVRFFLLDDLLTADRLRVRFFLPFDGFTRSVATPANVEEYDAYMAASIGFVRSRNARIDARTAGTGQVPRYRFSRPTLCARTYSESWVGGSGCRPHGDRRAGRTHADLSVRTSRPLCEG